MKTGKLVVYSTYILRVLIEIVGEHAHLSTTIVLVQHGGMQNDAGSGTAASVNIFMQESLGAE